jgi:excisionase family DNA binding protein
MIALDKLCLTGAGVIGYDTSMKNKIVLLTKKQVAARLQCSEITVHRYIKQGKIKAVKIGRLVRVDERELGNL